MKAICLLALVSCLPEHDAEKEEGGKGGGWGGVTGRWEGGTAVEVMDTPVCTQGLARAAGL